MIFVTGDTHGDVRRFSTKSFFEQKEMTKEKYMSFYFFDCKGSDCYGKKTIRTEKDILEGKSIIL